MTLDDAGGRKFVIALLSGASTSLLQWWGKLDAAGMAYGISIAATVGAYITGDIFEKKHVLEAETKREKDCP
jgi:hypothetical protein